MSDAAAPGPALRWIDTHCHLDAAEFAADRAEAVARARAAGVTMQVIPAVGVWNFGRVRSLAHEFGLAYALGIHPLSVPDAPDEDLDRLEQALREHRDDPRLVAVGEIGVDLFVPGLVAIRPRQEHFYREQLRIARRAGLPVLVHVRRSADAVLAGLRRIEVPGGIAHAFNGSAQQARAFAERGFALGLGGAMTYARALQIRRHAVDMGLEHLVLETDAPDIAPAWLHEPERRNAPHELARIADVLAELRGMPREDVVRATTGTALRVLPRLHTLYIA